MFPFENCWTKLSVCSCFFTFSQQAGHDMLCALLCCLQSDIINMYVCILFSHTGPAICSEDCSFPTVARSLLWLWLPVCSSLLSLLWQAAVVLRMSPWFTLMVCECTEGFVPHRRKWMDISTHWWQCSVNLNSFPLWINAESNPGDTTSQRRDGRFNMQQSQQLQ